MHMVQEKVQTDTADHIFFFFQVEENEVANGNPVNLSSSGLKIFVSQSSLNASMAFLQSSSKPISHNPHITRKPVDHSHSLSVIPRNLAFLGPGLRHVQHGSVKIFRSSNRTEAVTGNFL